MKKPVEFGMPFRFMSIVCSRSNLPWASALAPSVVDIGDAIKTATAKITPDLIKVSLPLLKEDELELIVFSRLLTAQPREFTKLQQGFVWMPRHEGGGFVDAKNLPCTQKFEFLTFSVLILI